MKRRRWLVWSVSLAVAAVAAGWMLGPKRPARAAPAPAAVRPLPVSTVLVRPAAFAETLQATGTLRADEGVELQAEVTGKITAILFTEGAPVRRGDLLVKLNDAELVAARDRAAARLELARLREQRLGSLLRNGGINRQEYDTARSELDVQEAEVRLIAAQLGKTEIRAPFDGVVGLRFVSEGAFVTATTRVATLQRLEELKLDFSVPEKYAAQLRPGLAVRFAAAGGAETGRGAVYAIDPRIDAATRTVVLRARVPNAGARLLPGAFAHVTLELPGTGDAILVPAAAVVPGVSEKSVFVVADGRAERRRVELGTRTEREVQVLAGLRAGDLVITSGLQQLRAGLPVQPALPARLAGGAGASAGP